MTALYRCDICGETSKDPTMGCLIMGKLEAIQKLGESSPEAVRKHIYKEDHICSRCKMEVVAMIDKLKGKK